MFFTIPTNIPILGDLQISETMVVSWIVMAVIAVLCLWLTHDLKVTNISKRQAVAEFLVEKANNFVRGNTGGYKFDYMIPFIAALFTTIGLPTYCSFAFSATEYFRVSYKLSYIFP